MKNCWNGLWMLLRSLSLPSCFFRRTLSFRLETYFCTALMYFTVLYCIILYSTVLYCTVQQYCTVLYCSVLYCTVLYCTVKYIKSCTKEETSTLECGVKKLQLFLSFPILFYFSGFSDSLHSVLERRKGKTTFNNILSF